jgi:uncharacterized protein
MSFSLIFYTVLAVFFASQVFWFYRFRKTRRSILAVAAVVYLGMFAYSFNWFGRRSTPTTLTWDEALLAAPFAWWAASSMLAFLLVLPFRLFAGVKPSPGRRAFLEKSVAAVPFVAGAYGLFYGRLNLEVARRPIWLARLPKAFEGFRIAQISDIHIGPFMTEEEIRRYAAICNETKPDLIALTGDFVTWDPGTQQALVRALSGLRAPLGVFGCLGNHDAWAGVEDSLTRLFGAAGIRILRQQAAPIQTHGETLNLLGIDFAGSRHMPQSYRRRFRPDPLREIAPLLSPATANILLSHNPDTFDDAAEMGIDLSLAGHTHGGQLALEFISPQIAPSRLVTPYVSGLFEKPGGQLYVNRGIGTIGVPMRVGSPPEITVFELHRRA